MKHTEWKQYMHETAERCRRQIAVELRARARPYAGQTVTATFDMQISADGHLSYVPGHERPLDWFEAAVRRGCTDVE